jgi:hypothetical protein
MTSILKVDTIQDTAGNNIINESSDTITIGASGDTITIPSGATISNLGTASGFGGANEAKAWVNFNGTGTPAIREDFNVTSITDNGTGDYTVNFTNALTDANYSVVASTSNIQGTAASGSVNIFSTDAVTQQAPTTNNFRFLTPQYDWSALRDPQYVCVSVFR